MNTDQEVFLRHRVKTELRKRMRALRASTPAQACAAKSRAIVERLLLLPPVVEARSVALFWPMEGRHEVDLRALDTRLRERGVRVIYPATDAETGSLRFRFVNDLAAMQTNDFGLLEPSPAEPEALPGDVDVIIAPALAVDSRGHRIGYGAGHYDRALPSFSASTTVVCVAFDFQLLVELPNTPEDVPAAFVVTEARALTASNFRDV